MIPDAPTPSKITAVGGPMCGEICVHPARRYWVALEPNSGRLRLCESDEELAGMLLHVRRERPDIPTHLLVRGCYVRCPGMDWPARWLEMPLSHETPDQTRYRQYAIFLMHWEAQRRKDAIRGGLSQEFLLRLQRGWEHHADVQERIREYQVGHIT